MSNRARTQFECGGVAFDVGRLNLNDSCNGLELLAKVLGPAISQLQDNPASALTALLGQASQIPKLIALFAPVAKVARNSEGTYGAGEGFAMVDVKPFVEQVFAGRLDLACAFLAECVRLEYSTFLSSASNGALAQLLAKV
jgi:hypothetical protein